MAPTPPVSIPSRLVEGGRNRLAVYRQDFSAHYEGGAYRHTADQTDMNPPIENIGGETVQETLENLYNNFISDGTGFVSIGHSDGYQDGYISGTYNVTDSISFAEAFSQALQDQRLINGGVIFIIAGTYRVNQKINVPAGITVFGENKGTYIIGETSNISLFEIEAAQNNIHIGGNATVSDTGSNALQTKFINLSIFDNLNGSSATLTSVPIISQQKGSNLYLENVSFFGKLNNGSSLNRVKTKSAIGTVDGISQGTFLSIKKCYFDGLKVCIEFIPQNGELDFCFISESKFRFFGKESLVYSSNEDCCILASPCNLNINSNYINGQGSNAKTLLTLTTTSGDVEKIRLTVSNNIGKIENSRPLLIDNQSTKKALIFSIYGNNWTYYNQSSWYIVVGGSDTNSVGDLFGENALDLALKWANASNLITTIILNPGNYYLTLNSSISQNISNVKIIGNKIGSSYPTVWLQLATSTTDSLNQKYFILGNHVESIYFASLSEFQSISPSFNALSSSLQNSVNLLSVKDCIFYNVSLNIMDPGSSFEDHLGFESVAKILIENCHFHQDDSFDDSISLVCPIVHQTNINNCSFTGNGYAANIGTETYTYSGMDRPFLEINNLRSNLNNLSINNTAPGSAENSYFIINDTNAKVNIKNCQILADINFGNVEPIDVSLLEINARFDKFIKIIANEISIEDSVFSGPNQSYQISSTDYAMPCLYLYPHSSLNFIRNKIYSGALPLQIVGILNDTSTRGNINICDSQICHINNSITQTLLDIDIDPTNLSLLTSLNLSNNLFISRCDSSNSIQIYHEYHIGSTYNTNAFVQIYCRGLDVFINNNKIYGSIIEPIVNTYNYFSGLFVNNLISDLGSSDKASSLSIYSNNIQINSNNFSSILTSKGSCACFAKTSQLLCSNNFFMMGNDASLSNSLISCMTIDVRSTLYARSAIISNNFFSRNKNTGEETNLVRGYINILSSTNFKGQIINNQFSSETIDGTSLDVIVDDSGSNWISEKNKNQTKTLVLRGNCGSLGLKKTSATNYVTTGLIPAVTDSNCAFNYNDSSTIVFNYEDTAEDQSFNWSIPLSQFVPNQAYIVEAGIDIIVNSNPSNTSIATLYLRKSSVSINDFSNPLTISGDNLKIITGSSSYINDIDNSLSAELVFRCDSSSRVEFTASELTIKYRW